MLSGNPKKITSTGDPSSTHLVISLKNISNLLDMILLLRNNAETGLLIYVKCESLGQTRAYWMTFKLDANYLPKLSKEKWLSLDMHA